MKKKQMKMKRKKNKKPIKLTQRERKQYFKRKN